MAVPVTAIVGRREMRDGRVSLRERDGSQADIPVSRLQARVRPVGMVGKVRFEARIQEADIHRQNGHVH